MTTLKLPTVVNSISLLSIAGIKRIFDFPDIPQGLAGYSLPVLSPDPVNVFTNMTFENAALGLGAASKWNIEYDLNYILFFAEMGTGRGLENIGKTVTLALAVAAAIVDTATVTGAVTLKFRTMAIPGPVIDQAGKQFFGTSIVFHVLEFVR